MEAEVYDAAGRQSQRRVTIPGDATYTYTRTFNPAGLPDVLTYPASAGYALSVKFGYSYGIPTSITDTSDSPNVTLWTANAGDPRGQLTQETLGNGVVVGHAFDGVTGLPNTITAGLGGGAALQNNSYMFDAVGNLIQRQDGVAGTTENVYPDVLNRLDHTVGDTNTKITYDTMGRIATWEALGASTNVDNYTTPQSGCTYYANAQPHAIRMDTQGSWPPSSYCYDANGNLTTESSSGTVNRSATWMSFNQPNKIIGGSSYSQFLYDQNHQRFEQIASYSGSPETTEYIGGLVEKMTNSSGTSFRYYVPAGNNYIVYNRWLSGVNAIYYATKNNLGSTAVITDSKGAQAVNEKYSALGWQETTGQDQAIMANITRHEFTGAEGLDNAGLWMVNMNGRVYVPSGSRFTSPDPNIFDPTNTQDYNRYSYVHNNPMTYVDPTGFSCQDVTYTEDIWTLTTGPFGSSLWVGTMSSSAPVCSGPGGGGNGGYQSSDGGGGGGDGAGISPAAQARALTSLPEVLVRAGRLPKLPTPVIVDLQNYVTVQNLEVGKISIDEAAQSNGQCTAAQQAAAQLAAQLKSVSHVSEVLAATSALGTLLSGAGEGITLGFDTPATVTFGSMTAYFTAVSFVTGAGASAANSFAKGNLAELEHFDFDQLRDIAISAAAKKIPGFGELADTLYSMGEAAADLVERAKEACQ